MHTPFNSLTYRLKYKKMEKFISEITTLHKYYLYNFFIKKKVQKCGKQITKQNKKTLYTSGHKNKSVS